MQIYRKYTNIQLVIGTHSPAGSPQRSVEGKQEIYKLERRGGGIRGKQLRIEYETTCIQSLNVRDIIEKSDENLYG